MDVPFGPDQITPADVDPGFDVVVRPDAVRHVIEMSGELDLASAHAATEACAASGVRDVIVDLTHLDFMDCAGHRALLEGRAAVERRGGSLCLVHAHGEPLRLMQLLAEDGSGMRPIARCLDQPAADGEGETSR